MGKNYFVDGITTVIDPDEALHVFFDGIQTSIHKSLLTLQEDEHGNSCVLVPISHVCTFCILGIFVIDAPFVKMLETTSLHQLVVRREGCWAVSGFQVYYK